MTRARSIFGGSLGNLVEWYDLYAYSAFSLYFAKSFFPAGDLTAQLLQTSGVFALGFLMRPIGGWLMGRIADRHGRKTALSASVLMMCGGSLMIALTPGYATIGVAAPALLMAARLLQGLSVGGEYGAAATYLAEIATPEHRGFWSSFQYVTLILGMLLASVVLLLLQFVFLTDAEISAWGWRIPFFIGAGLAVVGLYLRRGIAETPDFLAENRVARERAGGLRELLRHRRAVLLAIGIAMGGNVFFYTFTAYMQKYLVATAGFSKSVATLVWMLALCVLMIAQPLAGALSDRIGRRPLLIWFGGAGMVLTVPLLAAIGQAQSPLAALLWLSLAMLILTGSTAVAAVVKAELFPAEVRGLGVALPYAISVALFGGTAENIALRFKQAGHEAWFGWYVSAIVAVSLIVYLVMPETRWSSRMASSSRN